jgi:hypothetical protein
MATAGRERLPLRRSTDPMPTISPWGISTRVPATELATDAPSLLASPLQRFGALGIDSTSASPAVRSDAACAGRSPAAGWDTGRPPANRPQSNGVLASPILKSGRSRRESRDAMRDAELSPRLGVRMSPRFASTVSSVVAMQEAESCVAPTRLRRNPGAESFSVAASDPEEQDGYGYAPAPPRLRRPRNPGPVECE